VVAALGVSLLNLVFILYQCFLISFGESRSEEVYVCVTVCYLHGMKSKMAYIWSQKN
jgi:hypothetical protein